VNYFVNAQQFSAHPIYEAVVQANPALAFTSSHEPGTSQRRQELFHHLVRTSSTNNDRKTDSLVVPAKLQKFERAVERAWIQHLQTYCQHELNNRQSRLEAAKGFFGIGADWEKVRQITAEKLEACERLSALGYSIQHY